MSEQDTEITRSAPGTRTEDEKTILAAYQRSRKIWNWYAFAALVFKVLFLAVAGTGAVLAAALPNQNPYARWFAIGAALGALAATLVDKFGTAAQWRVACSNLVKALDKYRVGAITIEELIESRHAAEMGVEIMTGDGYSRSDGKKHDDDAAGKHDDAGEHDDADKSDGASKPVGASKPDEGSKSDDANKSADPTKPVKP